MKKLPLLLLLLMYAALAIAQKQVKGVIKDNAGKPVERANINLKDADGNILKYTQTKSDGTYSISIADGITNLSIEATCIGYNKAVVNITDINKSYDLVLSESEMMLKEVKIKYKPTLNLNGDTLNYRTADFAGNQDRSIGDVLKKMPGIEVAEDGKISYNGKSISNFYLDGDNLLDDRYNIASRSIPHGVVDQVQVIQKDQPVKMLQKNNTSDNVALNLVIKEEAKLQVLGEGVAGLGVPNRFAGSATAILLNKKVKFINNITGNNIGYDPGIDITSHNTVPNAAGGYFLSAGAAGVPVLPQNRYLFNKAGLINLNNLVNLTKTLQLKANVSYLIDERHQQYQKLSETYLPGQTISYTELQDNTINLQKMRIQLNFRKNSEQRYFDDSFTLDYNPAKTISTIITNNTPANQLLNQQTLNIANVLTSFVKLRSGYIINLSSSISNVSKPESLAVMPGLNEAVFNNNNPYAGLNQYVKIPTWYTSNSAFISLTKNNFRQTYKAGFDVQHQRLNTAIYRVQNNGDQQLVSPTMVNDLTWLKSKFYTGARYEYTSTKLTATIDLPLSFNATNYNDKARGLNQDNHNIFIDPNLHLVYKTGAENSVTINYGFNNNQGNINDVYPGAILTNYRLLTANNAPISLIRSQSMSAVYNFTRAAQMLFINFSANYADMGLNTISSYNLSNNIQQRVILYFPTHNRSLNLDANASKYLFAFKTTINGGVNYRQSWGQQLQNNQLFTSNMQTISYKAGVIGRLARFIDWSYNLKYDVSSSKAIAAGVPAISNVRLRQQSTLSFTTLKNVYVNVSGEYMYTQQRGQQDLKYFFADMNINVRLPKSKTDIALSVTNLANIKTFNTIDVTANSLTTASFTIPGRVVMLKTTFSF
jgi:hypothetical protein